MPTFRCDKLVRDNIPDLHRESGHTVTGRRLGGDALVAALIKKLHEEADEVSGALTLEELKEELADILQIINDICSVKDIAQESLLRTMKQKAERKGGFLQGAYIETVAIPSDNNDKWVRYFRRSPEKYPEEPA